MKILFYILSFFLALVLVYFFAGVLFTYIARTEQPIEFNTIYNYWYYYGHEKRIASLLKLSGLISTAVITGSLILVFKPKPKSLHGDAKFAKDSDVKKAGLLTGKGIVIGKRNNKVLRLTNSLHAFMAAATRSGKGVGIVVPNLLNWPDSCVALDMKKENWRLTAGFRKKHGQSVFLFDPVSEDLKTHQYNPLGYISENKNLRINDVQKIASMLWPETSGEAGHWDGLARSLFLGVVLYLLDTDGLPVTLGEVVRQVMKKDLDRHFSILIKERANTDYPLARECVDSFNSFSGTSDKTRSSILSSVVSTLELWQNPLIDAATSTNTFDLRDLRRKKMTIYVGVTPDNITRMKPILSLFFQHVVDLNITVLPEDDKTLKHECLLLMDEFASLGKLKNMVDAVSFIAGYGLRLLPIVQSPAQLYDIYGEHATNNFMNNHAAKILFTPNNVSDARDISARLGKETIKHKTKGRSSSSGKVTRNTNYSEQGRDLMLPQELMEMDNKKSILLLDGQPPIEADKIRYYEDKEMSSRIIDPPRIKSLVIEDFEPIEEIDNLEEENEVAEIRNMNINDITSKKALKLDDLVVDFSDIEVPENDLSPDEIDSLATQFMDALA